MRNAESVSWVVYRVMARGEPLGTNAVCEQGEWDAMERDKPGQHALVRAGIRSESEAEKLARGASGDAKPRTTR